MESKVCIGHGGTATVEADGTLRVAIDSTGVHGHGKASHKAHDKAHDNPEASTRADKENDA